MGFACLVLGLSLTEFGTDSVTIRVVLPPAEKIKGSSVDQGGEGVPAAICGAAIQYMHIYESLRLEYFRIATLSL